MFNLMRCSDPEGTKEEDKRCKTDAELNEFLNGLIMIFIYNKETYEPNLYGEDTITRETTYEYLTLSANSQPNQEVLIHK